MKKIVLNGCHPQLAAPPPSTVGGEGAQALSFQRFGGCLRTVHLLSTPLQEHKISRKFSPSKTLSFESVTQSFGLIFTRNFDLRAQKANSGYFRQT